MSLSGALRGLALLSKAVPQGSASVSVRQLQSAVHGLKGFATDVQLSKKDVVYLLDNRDDPEVDSAVKEYLTAQYKSAKTAADKPEESYELASKIEKKYVAAQVVEYGIQNIAVPLGYGKDTAPVKRFVSQLVKLGHKAGFEDPAAEVEKRLTEKAQTAETAKEFLARVKPYTSAEYHAALWEALLAVEAETNSTVTLDGSSAGYKKFAEKVKAVATANNIPWKLLVDAKRPAGDEEAQGTARKAYQAWAQSARVADAVGEIEVLKAEAAALLDKHLAKTADQVKQEQTASLASLQKKIEAAKGAKWAAQFQEDLKTISWFDSAIATNPAVGPRATA
eukprot:CAMPEP_0202900146 /NCGR_PEP_ID=MMETSP1392-20130828/10115_1 /ASSEMBLY_ACC=CAM_ASM_000868 /TAXON_ID=225041 /ORGANISM="Chlamydomonas chlamydogama, Strain SAG 11-48b" /LENGTH=336 /DNA_ID=CAMNT_0049586479 /DNA_START=112 /DNA_END=1122 /DNA_ORIENTATION=+